jgi:hypothetical protein
VRTGLLLHRIIFSNFVVVPARSPTCHIANRQVVPEEITDEESEEVRLDETVCHAHRLLSMLLGLLSKEDKAYRVRRTRRIG